MVKHVLQYTGIVLTLELVISRIKARELELHTFKKPGNNLFVKGKFEKEQNSFNNNENGGSRPKGKQNGKKGKQNKLYENTITMEKRVTLKNTVMIL